MARRGSLPLLLARAVGLIPYRRLRSGEYRTSATRQAFSIIVFSISSALSYWSYYVTHGRLHSESTVAQNAYLLSAQLSLCHSVVLAVSLLFLEFRVVGSLLNDSVMRRASKGCSSLPFILFSFYAAVNSILAAHEVIMMLTNSKGDYSVDSRTLKAFVALVSHLGDVYCSCVKCVNICLFAHFVCVIQHYVESINEKIFRIIHADRGVYPDEIRLLRKEYKVAYNLTWKVCFCFAPPVLTSFVENLCWVVLETYEFVLSSTATRPFFIADALTIIVAKGLLLFMTQRLTSKGAETLLIIYSLRNSRRFGFYENHELAQFSRQVEQQPVVVSLFGTFELNIRLLFQSGGMVLTYVILLVQFQSSQC